VKIETGVVAFAQVALRGGLLRIRLVRFAVPDIAVYFLD